MREVGRLLANIIQSLRIKEFTADLAVGLSSPVDTGLLFAVIGPVSSYLNSATPVSILLKPVFRGASILEGYLEGVIRLSPIKLVLAITVFIFSFPVLKVLWKLFRIFRERRSLPKNP